MVFKKRLNYGSSRHKIPAIPEVPKSARGKRSVRKKVGGNRMCAFDLLATVAGNLLLEGQNSLFPPVTIGTLNLSTTAGIIKQEPQVDDEKLLCSNGFDHQSNIEGRAGSEVVSGQQTANKLKDDPLMFSATTSGPISSLVKSVEVHCAVVSAESLAVSNKGEVVGPHFIANTEKWHAMSNSSGFMESNEFKGEGNKAPIHAEHLLVPNVFDENVAKVYPSEGAMDLDTQLPFATSHRSAEVPLCKNNSHLGSCQKDAVGMELSVDKDDDENSSGCTDCSIPYNKTSRQKPIVYQKARKPLVSKYWKVASRIMRHDQLCDYDVVSKSALRNKICYTRQRKQRGPFKRRKFVERYSGFTSIGGLPTLCKKGCLKLEQCDFQENKPEAKGISSFASGKMSTYDSSDYHVKLRIKSFKVPELYIDIPETATVGSLKQTVMEAVTTILQGGLHVGVLIRGKKVKDDNKTLRQAGISLVDELDSVDFTLEPNSSKTPSLTSEKDPDSRGITDDSEPLARMPPGAPAAVDQGASDSNPQPVLTFCHESDHDSVHSPAGSSLLDKSESDSRALVTVSPLSAEMLAVQMRKSQQSEVAQRRLRRPFTVAEVEALVQAVEKFGTGRWRDVKICAFDNAKHRTYVDLKDKWKTLVHTAQISPQQRRGEPVPQELLDRVLAAHSFWSHPHSKLQVKSPPRQVEPLSAL